MLLSVTSARAAERAGAAAELQALVARIEAKRKSGESPAAELRAEGKEFDGGAKLCVFESRRFTNKTCYFGRLVQGEVAFSRLADFEAGNLQLDLLFIADLKPERWEHLGKAVD